MLIGERTEASDYTSVRPSTMSSSENSTIASSEASRSEKDHTSFTSDLESQHTRLSAQKAHSQFTWPFSFKSQSVTEDRDGFHSIQFFMIDASVSYMTIGIEDQFYGKDARKIRTQPTEGFMNAFEKIVRQNDGWFHRILSARLTAAAQHLTNIPLTEPQPTEIYHIVLSQDKESWNGFLQPDLGGRAEFLIPHKELLALDKTPPERTAYWLLLLDMEMSFVVVFQPVEWFGKEHCRLTFSLYRGHECTDNRRPFEDCFYDLFE
jgi:hypothetical protein